MFLHHVIVTTTSSDESLLAFDGLAFQPLLELWCGLLALAILHKCHLRNQLGNSSGLSRPGRASRPERWRQSSKHTHCNALPAASLKWARKAIFPSSNRRSKRNPKAVSEPLVSNTACKESAVKATPIFLNHWIPNYVIVHRVRERVLVPRDRLRRLCGCERIWANNSIARPSGTPSAPGHSFEL